MNARAAAVRAWLADEAALEREVREELATHVDEARRANLALGLGPAEALERARASLGDLEAHVAASVAARSRGIHTMKTVFTLLSAALLTALTFSMVQSHRLRGEVAETRRLLVELTERAEAPREPRMPAPVVFAVGDRLAVHDRLHPELDCRPVVAGDGMVLLPELGWIEAHGKERGAFEAELNVLYASYFEDTSVVVALEASAD